jgi:hypothetical protein
MKSAFQLDSLIVKEVDALHKSCGKIGSLAAMKAGVARISKLLDQSEAARTRSRDFRIVPPCAGPATGKPSQKYI